MGVVLRRPRSRARSAGRAQGAPSRTRLRGLVVQGRRSTPCGSIGAGNETRPGARAHPVRGARAGAPVSPQPDRRVRGRRGRRAGVPGHGARRRGQPGPLAGRRARRPWREVLAAFVQAGRGLAAAHAAGLVHGDFKPDNVVVEESTGRVRVVDFGLARAAGTRSARRPCSGRRATWRRSSGPGARSTRAPTSSRSRSRCTRRCSAGIRIPPADAADARARRRGPRGRAPARIERAPGPRTARPIRPTGSRRWTALARPAAAAPGRAARRPGRPRRWSCPARPDRRPPPGGRRRGGGALRRRAGPGGRRVGSRPARPARARLRRDRATARGDQRRARGRGARPLRRSWLAMYRDACLASARGEQSPDLLDRRMACLDRRLAQMRARTALLRRAGRGGGRSRARI